MQQIWMGLGLLLTGLAWLAQDRYGMTWLAPLLLALTGVAVMVASRRNAAPA